MCEIYVGWMMANQVRAAIDFVSHDKRKFGSSNEKKRKLLGVHFGSDFRFNVILLIFSVRREKSEKNWKE